ncbi:DUF1289 domain-containing protein [Bosea sp. BH3]|uniref:DUF1289 domain-containing protein n=1 Tax=Bosea sp. BH3 TaxID=2871701 RepID=UPI0021CB6415|nr:DUF1289 domain-containing protein [Bosea sp. BH3]MCU4182173.1 DUF1289 domain-containing protein [Bosea sp. BH3]
MTAISTPCIKVCVIDPASKLCEGCGRTLAEIAQWGRFTEVERLAIIAALPDRLPKPSNGYSPGPAKSSKAWPVSR